MRRVEPRDQRPHIPFVPRFISLGRLVARDLAADLVDHSLDLRLGAAPRSGCGALRLDDCA